MFTIKSYFCFAFLCLFFLNTSFIFAEKTPGNDLEIILDSSGSMNSKIQNRIKMDVAKEILSAIVNDIPEGSFVGFRAYGHQSPKNKHNCKDSELLFPVSPIDKTELTKIIHDIEPKGYSPIAYSLKQVAKDFNQNSDFGKVVLLISDGEETCKGDPCAVVKDLRRKGFDIKINTIGFKVNETASQQLRCIAKVSGGSYMYVKDVNEFNLSARQLSLSDVYGIEQDTDHKIFSIGGSKGVNIHDDGVRIGNERGVRANSKGFFIGGSRGVNIDKHGVRIGGIQFLDLDPDEDEKKVEVETQNEEGLEQKPKRKVEIKSEALGTQGKENSSNDCGDTDYDDDYDCDEK